MHARSIPAVSTTLYESLPPALICRSLTCASRKGLPATGLVVKRQEVVSGLRKATDRRSAVDALMGTMPVVVMDPAFKHGGSLRGVVVGNTVGPFSERRLDEALGLAVG